MKQTQCCFYHGCKNVEVFFCSHRTVTVSYPSVLSHAFPSIISLSKEISMEWHHDYGYWSDPNMGSEVLPDFQLISRLQRSVFPGGGGHHILAEFTPSPKLHLPLAPPWNFQEFPKLELVTLSRTNSVTLSSLSITLLEWLCKLWKPGT